MGTRPSRKRTYNTVDVLVGVDNVEAKAANAVIASLYDFSSSA